MFYVYLLKSEKDGSWYTGFSENLKQRFAEHQSGKCFTTRKHAPYKLIYYEAYLNKKDALGREKFLKSGSGRKFLTKQLTHYFKNTNPL